MTELPLSLLAPVRLAADTPNGYFVSHKKSDPPFLTFNWEGQVHLLRLGPPDAFYFYALKPGYSATGTLISNIHIIVDLESRYDATHETDPLGAVVLEGGNLNVIAVRAGDTFGDPGHIPLWGGLPSGSDEQKVGFTRWRIVARDGEDEFPLWEMPIQKSEADSK